MISASFLERNEELVNRYGHLLEGVGHHSGNAKMAEYEQNKLMILLDNLVQNRAQIHRIDPRNLEGKSLEETMTKNAAIATMVTAELPLIRKVYPNMMTRELISIQPISQPAAKVFYHDIQRGTGADDGTSLSTSIHSKRTYGDNVEYNESSPTAIKEIKLVITSEDVSATEKKLKSKWTVESEQDLYAYHGLNAESELSLALASEIVREWDRTILQAMIDGATGGSATFDMTVPAGLTYEDRKYWMETLYEKFIDVDNAIFKKRYRRTNFIVLPADQAAFVDKMSGFRADSVSFDEKVIATGGRYFMGTLNSRWRVYVDPFLSGTILMGYNNPGNWMDTAFVFAPYILSYFSDTFQDPDTFVKTRAILSRAAMKVTVGDLLGTITVTGS
jgi:hypothetical protein